MTMTTEAVTQPPLKALSVSVPFGYLNEVGQPYTVVRIVDAYNFLRDSSWRGSLPACGELLGEEGAHTPATEESGIRNFFYRARQLFLPPRVFSIWSRANGRAWRALKVIAHQLFDVGRFLAVGALVSSSDPLQEGRTDGRRPPEARTDRQGPGRGCAAGVRRHLSVDQYRDGRRSPGIRDLAEPLSRMGMMVCYRLQEAPP